MSSKRLVSNLLHTIIDTDNEDSEALLESTIELLSLTISPDTFQKQMSLMNIAKENLLNHDEYCCIWLYDRCKSVLYPHRLLSFDEDTLYMKKIKDTIADVITDKNEEFLSESAKLSLYQALECFNKKYQNEIDSHNINFNTYLIPMIYNEEIDNKEFTGIFHLHTRKELSKNWETFLDYLVGGLSRTTMRVRQKTRLEAIQDLHNSVEEHYTTDECLVETINIIYKICKPELCIAYQRDKNQKLVAVASVPRIENLSEYTAHPDSLIKMTAQDKKKQRILEFKDQEELMDVTGRTNYDEILYDRIAQNLEDHQVRSYCLVPVVSEGRTHAVIHLINKRSSFCQRLTQNDEIIANSLARGVKSAIALAEMNRVTTSMAEHVFSDKFRVAA